eukprot:scaffold327_cov13-Tisochrysis_lutea.AAC.1
MEINIATLEDQPLHPTTDKTPPSICAYMFHGQWAKLPGIPCPLPNWNSSHFPGKGSLQGQTPCLWRHAQLPATSIPLPCYQAHVIAPQFEKKSDGDSHKQALLAGFSTCPGKSAVSSQGHAHCFHAKQSKE